MKKKIILYFILFSLILLTLDCFAKTKIELVKVIDGDTIKARIEKEEFSIRLKGIDCFETSDIYRAYYQAYQNNLSVEQVIEKGMYSKNYLEKISKDTKNVYFDFLGLDKYKRVLGVVYFDKLNVNSEMIKNGFCSQYNYNN